MSIYLTLGTFSDNGAAAIVGCDSDHRTAMESLFNSVGAKLVDYHNLRGQNNFCVIAEANSFSKIASMTLLARGSGAVENIGTLESIDIEEIRSVAKGVQYTPPSGCLS